MYKMPSELVLMRTTYLITITTLQKLTGGMWLLTYFSPSTVKQLWKRPHIDCVEEDIPVKVAYEHDISYYNYKKYHSIVLLVRIDYSVWRPAKTSSLITLRLNAYHGLKMGLLLIPGRSFCYIQVTYQNQSLLEVMI